MRRFEGKAAIVTGGANGIGLACVRRLLSEGASVTVVDRNAAAWPVAMEVLGDWIGAVAFAEADVTREDEVEQAVVSATKAFGPVSVLVNNAGGTVTERFSDTTLSNWQRDIELNLTSQYIVAAAVLRGMAETGGTIVNVSSVNAVSALGNPAYSAAKSGVIALTRSLAIEYARNGIRVNAVAPGSVLTGAWDFRTVEHPELLEKLLRWYPGGYIGVPDDVAAAVAFLAAPESRYVNGATLVVDGGLTAGSHLMIDDIIG